MEIKPSIIVHCVLFFANFHVAIIIKLLNLFIPWSVYCIENGNCRWNVDCNVFWKMGFWHQHACGNYYAIEEEGDPMSNNLPDKEECVDDMELLPHGHFL